MNGYTIYLSMVVASFALYMFIFLRVDDGTPRDEDMKMAFIAAIVWFVSIPLALKVTVEWCYDKYRTRKNEHQ